MQQRKCRGGESPEQGKSWEAEVTVLPATRKLKTFFFFNYNSWLNLFLSTLPHHHFISWSLKDAIK